MEKPGADTDPVVILSPKAKNFVFRRLRFRTCTENEQLDVSSPAEGTEQVTGVVPRGNCDPEAGTHELLETSCPLTVGRGKETVAEPDWSTKRSRCGEHVKAVIDPDSSRITIGDGWVGVVSLQAMRTPTRATRNGMASRRRGIENGSEDKPVL